MDTLDLFDLRRAFNDRDVMICFNGPFSRSIIEELGNAVKRYLETEDVAKSAMMDVFSVYIEQTQNIRNYSGRTRTAEGERPASESAIVVIAREGDRYVVSSGNMVERADAAALVERLDRLRGLDPAGLKALYKEQLHKPREAAHAGLGLIDMARKACRPLAYSIRPIDDRHSFFSLHAAI